jgi:hypothetical protein
VRLRVATLLAVAAALGAAVPAGATTSQEAIDFLNQQRSANGIPPSAVFDEHKTTGCRNHNEYMAQNGLGHGEDPGNPGYTPEGADYTNSGEVAAQGGGGWSASTNPWDAAPLHQAILFDPRVGKSGYDESAKGFFCMRLELLFDDPDPPKFYAFTSNLGPQRVPPREVVCCEGPYAPQEAVGIPQNTPTGPNIIFTNQGFGYSKNHAVSYSLTGPGGAPVEAKFVDSNTPPPEGQSYRAFNLGGDLIPVQPLDPFTDYTATVTWADDDEPSRPNQTQTVQFKTDGFARGLTLTLSKKLAKGRKATLKAPAEAVGQKAKVKFKAKTSSTKTITLKQSQRIKVPMPRKHGRTVVTVSVPSFVLGDTRFTVTSTKRSYR